MFPSAPNTGPSLEFKNPLPCCTRTFFLSGVLTLRFASFRRMVFFDCKLFFSFTDKGTLNHDIADSEEQIFDFTISSPNDLQTTDINADHESSFAQIFADSDKSVEDDLIETFSCFYCSHCGKKFNRKDNQKLHERRCDEPNTEPASKRQKITDYFSAAQNATTTMESVQIGGGAVHDIQFTESWSIPKMVKSALNGSAVTCLLYTSPSPRDS